MKVNVKVFPASGLCGETQKLQLALEEGSLSEVMIQVQERYGISADKLETLMFLHNGLALDKREDIEFKNGDELWILPLLSGG